MEEYLGLFICQRSLFQFGYRRMKFKALQRTSLSLLHSSNDSECMSQKEK